jgi:uncharacterized SAM-binding protein YcdF (DUF218 family)
MTYVQPLILVFVVIALIGLVRVRQGKKPLISIVGVLGLLMLSWPPADWLLSRPLEARYPVRPFPSGSAQAIVVLSSAVSRSKYERPYALPDKATFERCEFAAWLYKHWQALPVLACGGPGAKGEEAVSGTMRQLLQRAGVPEAMIWTEERSRSTHENAVFGAEVLRKHGITRVALVIEAHAMLRAEACFRKQGVVVIPAPCEFREFEAQLEEFMPSAKAINRNEATFHETLGLAWYWLRRWI